MANKTESNNSSLKNKLDNYNSKIAILERLQFDNNITIEKVNLITNGPDVRLNINLMLKLKEDDIDSIESLRNRLFATLKIKDCLYGSLLNMLNAIKTSKKGHSQTPQPPTIPEKSNRAASQQNKTITTPQEKSITSSDEKDTNTSTSSEPINQKNEAKKSTTKDLDNNPPNQTYWTLAEDLALIKLAESKKPGVNQSWNKAIIEANIPEFTSRPKGAFSNRFRVFLQYLNNEEISMMKNYYETKGNGYVHFRRVPKIIHGEKRFEYHIYEINTNPNPICSISRLLGKKWRDEFKQNNVQANTNDNNNKEINPPRKKVKRCEGSQTSLVSSKDDNEKEQKIMDNQMISEILKNKVNTGTSPIIKIKTKIFPQINFSKYPDLTKFKSLDDIWNDRINISKIFEEKTLFIKSKNWEIYDKITIFSDFEQKIRKSTLEHLEDLEYIQSTKSKHAQGLELLSTHFNIPYNKIEKLHFQVSGNYETLQKYLQNSDENLLWSSEQDHALKAALGHPMLFKYLITDKGEENVKERTQFLEEMCTSLKKKEEVTKRCKEQS